MLQRSPRLHAIAQVAQDEDVQGPTQIDLDAVLRERAFERACGVDDPGMICRLVFDATGNEALASIAQTVIPSAFRILFVIVLAWVLNRLLRRGIRRFVRRLDEGGKGKPSRLRLPTALQNTAPLDVARAAQRASTIATVLRSLGTFTIWTVAILMVLDEVGLPVGPLIAGAGIAGIALGFGAQSLVKDFLSGIFMILEDQYGIGDIVDVGEAGGVVEAITLRTTRLRDVEGVVWHVPNGEIRRVGNKSQEWARSLMDVAVAYDTDLDHARAVLKRVADEIWQDPEWADLILDEPEVWGVESFGANEMLIRVVVKVKPARQFEVNRELRARIKDAFDAERIEIPFPQRTVWLRGEAAAPAPKRRAAKRAAPRS